MLRQEHGNAVIAMVTNAQGNVKDKAGRLLGFHDFAPHFEPPEEPIATEEDMKRMFRIKD